MQAVMVAGAVGTVQQGTRERLGELLGAFMARRSEATRRAYETDLQDFARYTESESVPAAVWALISDGPGRANSLALHYKGSMVASGKAPATVNRRLASLRSVVALARTLGLVSWALEVEGEKARAYRDTRGPGTPAVRAMLEAIQGEGPKALRDRALVRLMFDCALRRGEIVTLALADVELENNRLWIQGKGRNGEREAVTLPPATVATLGAWIEARGTDPGPLFPNFHHDAKVQGRGITGNGIYTLVCALGGKAGVKARPHGFRHTAITEAAKRTGGDVVKVQSYSRHRNPATVMRYCDNMRDAAGEVAALVAAAV